MSDAFKDVSTVPTLTLEPFQAEEEKKTAVQPEEPKLDDTILTEEERRMVHITFLLIDRIVLVDHLIDLVSHDLCQFVIVPGVVAVHRDMNATQIRVLCRSAAD